MSNHLTKSGGVQKIALIVLTVVLVLGLIGGGITIYVITRPQPIISLTSNYRVGTTPAGSTSTTFHVTGYKFSSNSAITFLLDGNTISGSQSTHSDANGNVSADLTITGGWSLGNHTLTAKDASGYLTNIGATVTIVPQGLAHTPGPNGAPPDDASFTLNATLSPSGGAAVQITLTVTGKPDPAGGTVCRANANADGMSHISSGTTSNGTSYQETIIKTCSGSYKSGQLSYTETVTSEKFDFPNSISCTALTPYIALHMDGTYSNQTTISGKFSEAAIDANCTNGTDMQPGHISDAQNGNWSSQQSTTAL